tara:strand:+ start:81 stop:293 length:213 start_codon:yes stop_codon:yes gene_type:complete
MSTETAKKQEQISILAKEAKGCRTDQQKIEFFDSSQEAFFTGSIESKLSVKESIPNEIDDAFYVYANIKK